MTHSLPIWPYSENPSPITEAQRQCLSHLLRNLIETLGATLALIENRTASFSLDDLLRCINNPARLLERMKTALENGSYCVLSREECAWIGKFCGCHGSPESASSETLKEAFQSHLNETEEQVHLDEGGTAEEERRLAAT